MANKGLAMKSYHISGKSTLHNFDLKDHPDLCAQGLFQIENNLVGRQMDVGEVLRERSNGRSSGGRADS